MAFRNGIIQARHCRSHQDRILTTEELQRQGEAQKYDRYANEDADRMCEAASAQHPALCKETMRKDKWAYDVATKVLHYAAEALELFPTEHEACQRAQESQTDKTIHHNTASMDAAASSKGDEVAMHHMLEMGDPTGQGNYTM